MAAWRNGSASDFDGQTHQHQDQEAVGSSPAAVVSFCCFSLRDYPYFTLGHQRALLQIFPNLFGGGMRAGGEVPIK